jgi:hypothetical protein
MSGVLEPNQVEYFTRKLHHEYDNRSTLRDWCNIQVYFDEDIRPVEDVVLDREYGDDEDFIQIGEWSQLPVDVVENASMNSMIIENFIQRLVNGEQNFLISNLDAESKDNSMPHTIIDEFDYENFKSISSNLRNPQHLILPTKDDIHNKVFDWGESGNYYFMNQEIVVANGRTIDVHWYSVDESTDLDGYGYLIEPDAMTVTQKWHGDSPDPEVFEHDERFDEFSVNRPLMLYFGTETKIDEDQDSEKLKKKTDFLYRSVVSPPVIDPEGIVQLRL